MSAFLVKNSECTVTAGSSVLSTNDSDGNKLHDCEGEMDDRTDRVGTLNTGYDDRSPLSGSDFCAPLLGKKTPITMNDLK